MSTNQTPEQIVAEIGKDSSVYVRDWLINEDRVVQEPTIGLDGEFTLDQLRAIVTVREKELGVVPVTATAWKLVPIEPTREMVVAAIGAALADSRQINGLNYWRAMIAAAPEYKP